MGNGHAGGRGGGALDDDEISRIVNSTRGGEMGTGGGSLRSASGRDKRMSLPANFNQKDFLVDLQREADAAARGGSTTTTSSSSSSSSSAAPASAAASSDDNQRRRSNSVLHPHLHIHLRRKSDTSALPHNTSDGGGATKSASASSSLAAPPPSSSESNSNTNGNGSGSNGSSPVSPSLLTSPAAGGGLSASPALPPSLLLRDRASTVGASRRSWRMSLPAAFTAPVVAASASTSTATATPPQQQHSPPSGSPLAVSNSPLSQSPQSHLLNTTDTTSDDASSLKTGDEETNTNTSSTTNGSNLDQPSSFAPQPLGTPPFTSTADPAPGTNGTNGVHTPLHMKTRKTGGLASSADILHLSDSPGICNSDSPPNANTPTLSDSQGKESPETTKKSDSTPLQKSKHRRRHSERPPTASELLLNTTHADEVTTPLGAKSSSSSNSNLQLSSPAPISLKRYTKRDPPPMPAAVETPLDTSTDDSLKSGHHHRHRHSTSSSSSTHNHKSLAAAEDEAPKKISAIKKTPQKVIAFGETQPRRLATGKKNPTNLTLIQLHFLDAGTETCWTMAIDKSCTAADLCEQFSEFDTDEDAAERSYRLFIVDGQPPETVPITQEFIESGVCSSQVQGDVVLQPLISAMEKTKKLFILVDSTAAKRTEKTPKTSTAILIDNPSEKTSWIPEDQIKYISKISSGTFAKVYKARYAGKIVAVKVLKSTCLDGKVLEEFKKEFAILRSTNHPNLVSFYGACVESRLCMVMEMCHRGTLVHLMSEPDVTFTWNLVIDFSHQAFSGLKFLHTREPAIMHRDLKSLNLLVTKKLIVKLADFGLSRSQTATNKSTLGRLVGTMNYCAPELYRGTTFTTASDVYSMGIIMWELAERFISGKYAAPFAEFPYIHFDFQILVQAAERNLRPTINPNCPEPFANLIRACWSPEPGQRPSATECLLQLEEFRNTCANWH
ncbi:Phagocytosis 2 [Pelomyxa schiedti]|nr:Phagocytosis 2 [Pelomyxa schiedti]